MNSVEVATKEIDYRQWIGSTADELGYGAGNQYDPFMYRHTADNGQQTNVFVVDGRRTDSDPTIINSTSYNYRIDQLLKRRAKITAHQAHARVIFTEFPGVTIDEVDPWHTDGDRITPLQVATSSLGKFDRVALGQLEAIDAYVHFSPGESIRLQAESLGTAAISGMVQVLGENRFNKQLSIEGVDIIESINAHGDGQFLRPYFVLKKLEDIEAPRHEFYFDENKIIGHADVTAFERMSIENKALWEYLTKKQKIAVTSPAIGLHRSLYGSLSAGIKAQKSFRDIPFTFYRGRESSVSVQPDNVALAEALTELGARYARVINLVSGPDDETEIGHHFGTSLGRYATYSQQLLTTY